MKRLKNVWEKTCTIENIEKHWHAYNAAVGKSKRQKWDLAGAEDILEHLKNHDVIIEPFKYRTIGGKERGSKTRELTIPSFKSIIAQNALLEYLGPFLNKKMHHRSYASRKNMGMHKSAKLQYKLVQKDPRIKYALVFDIKKFYNNINIEDLLKYLKDTAIKDKDIFETLSNLLRSHPNGLAVGFCASHYCANYYLCPLWDKIMNSSKNVVDCFVYMDNFVVYTRTKNACKKAKSVAEEWLRAENRGLEIKSDWQYFPVDKKPVKTCGVLIQRNKPLKLYDRTMVKTLRNIEKISKHFNESLFRGLGSRLGGLYLIHRMDLLKRYNISWEWLKRLRQSIHQRKLLNGRN